MTLRAKLLEGTMLWASNLMYELRRGGGTAALHPQTDILDLKKKGIPNYALTQIKN